MALFAANPNAKKNPALAVDGGDGGGHEHHRTDHHGHDQAMPEIGADVDRVENTELTPRVPERDEDPGENKKPTQIEVV